MYSLETSDLKKIRQERRSKTGEVFTPKEIVSRMLDDLPEEVWTDESREFLDPCGGNGNFVCAVLERKISLGHDITKALSTIYSVELMEDNVEEMKQRLLGIVAKHTQVTQQHIDIINKQIVCHDFFTYDFEFK